MRIHRSAAVLACVTGFALLGTACNENNAQGGGTETPTKGPAPTASKPVDGDAGKTLALGERTTVSYQRGSGRGTVLSVTAKSVTKGTVSDLDAVRLDAEERGMQPYYVTFDFENTGKSTLEYPFLAGAAKLRDSRGEDGTSTVTVGDEVKECPAAPVDSFAPGAKVTQCAVFLLPEGEQPSVIVYTGDYDKEPVFWRAGK
ncbi:hypothetical protein IHE55_13990 [Streptomyces pactum]|uniref:DUF4352 domain-containing protein n=1 Tax=Streptomyces pactum TaxID=68249 RepID=A0ABS0NKW8_9ACTN|nr:hypothetical protein [Streptomyces pactum]MBH5335840.1 hypothetical protein [Streptomyces pactum]